MSQGDSAGNYDYQAVSNGTVNTSYAFDGIGAGDQVVIGFP